MSKPELKSASGGVAVQKPQANVYTMMLILSFLAICVACSLLWLELKSYGEWPQWKVDVKAAPVVTTPVDDAPVDDVPAEPPVDEVPADGAPVDGAPVADPAAAAP